MKVLNAEVEEDGKEEEEEEKNDNIEVWAKALNTEKMLRED